MRQKTESKVWTVRNRLGQFIGTFRAYSADDAINQLIRSQAQTASSFRRSQPLAVKRDDFIAAVEG